MAFDDLAKRMGARPGVGSASGTTDPDQIIAEAQVAARRAARTRDLVLGSLLLVGGLIIVGLWISVLRDKVTTVDPRNTMVRGRDLTMMSYIAAAGAGAILVGVYRLLRAIGILKR